jgi:VanZ family protein
MLLSQLPGTDVDSTQAALARLDLGDLNSLARLGAHFGLFGVLALLVLGAMMATSRAGPGLRLTTVTAALGLTLVLGVADEVHQHFVPKRHFRWFDAAVDGAGAATALSAALAVDWMRRVPRPGGG